MIELREDASALEYCQKTVRKIVDHLVRHHGTDQRTKTILAKLQGVALLPMRKTGSTYSTGMFSHADGTLYVCPRDANGLARTQKSLNKTIVHELAHATRFKYLGETSHSTDWKSSWIFLLDVCTRELGMDVEVPCSSVSFYGLSRRDCPSCDWESAKDCGPYRGPPRG